MISSTIKLIGLDLDGTLLGEDSSVHEAERNAVQKARQAGVCVALATGRAILDTAPHAQTVGGVDWLITENGARVTSASGETIYEHAMSVSQLHLLTELCDAYGVEPSFYGKHNIWYGKQGMEFFDEVSRRRNGIVPVDRSHYDYIEDPAQWRELAEHQTIYKALVYGDAASLDEWLQQMQACGHFETEPSVFCSMKNIEITQKGTHKGKALLHLAQHLGLEADQVMACGDSDNDRTMLQTVGLGIAMANAPSHIRSLADAVTETNNDHGVCRAIEQYILQRA